MLSKRNYFCNFALDLIIDILSDFNNKKNGKQSRTTKSRIVLQ
jgi:hypothetical protein